MLSTPLGPIQASELAETRNEKAAFLSMPPLPITLKKGILLEKHLEIYLFGKGKGILSKDLEIAICSARPVVSIPKSSPSVTKATTPPVASKFAFRGSRCSMSSRSCLDPLTFPKCRSMFQVYLPSCMFVIVSWVSFMVKPEVVPGRWSFFSKRSCFRRTCSPSPLQTNACR